MVVFRNFSYQIYVIKYYINGYDNNTTSKLFAQFAMYHGMDITQNPMLRQQTALSLASRQEITLLLGEMVQCMSFLHDPAIPTLRKQSLMVITR